jgi:hypothetical protein
MQNSGDTSEYRAISRGCQACEALADQIEGIYLAGGYVKTEGWSVADIEVSNPGATGRVLAEVEIESAPTEYREAAGSPLQHLRGGSLVERMTLKPLGWSWLLVDLEQQAQ